MTTTMNVGIIGAGNISAAYLKLLPLFAGVRLAAIADIDPDRAAQRATEAGIDATSPQEMAARNDIGLVINLTIPQVHYEVTRSFIDAGKHVYSEKPFVLTLEEGLALKQAAADRGVLVGSAPDTFLGGSHQQLRAIVDSGSIGRVMSGTVHFMNRGMEAWHPNPDFFFRAGGGPILDMGPYYVSNLVNLLGPVEEISAFGNRAWDRRTFGAGPRKGEDFPVELQTTIHGLLRFRSGAVISLAMSWDVPAHRHGLIELYGTAGSFYAPDPNYFGGDILLSEGGQAEAVAAWSHPFGVPNWTRPNGEIVANYRGAGVADLIAAAREGRPARCSLDFALHVVEVLTSLTRAADGAGPQRMITTCARPTALDPAAAAALLAQ